MCVSAVLGGLRNKNYTCFFPVDRLAVMVTISGQQRACSLYSLDLTSGVGSVWEMRFIRTEG